MTSKIIITSVLILLFVSFSVLFAVEKMNNNYDYNKNWNVVYFNNPNDNSLDFTIENHQGVKGEYSYEVIAGGKSIEKGTAQIEAGRNVEISPNLNLEKIIEQDTIRISAEINYGDVKYNIYKDLK